MESNLADYRELALHLAIVGKETTCHLLPHGDMCKQMNYMM